ncbi:hypothetical protein SELR_14060 [Selenomonas ruminantium subsp. lactilytica TAM6421]|uniref:Nitrous oxide-stimulated promoter n=1 Tax=Selenomonas ruminantium subsp. lactilytica (strain NBRC 103574 / TAM6421) TaxID=927704 RepID=I0GQS7_SELRL|nr:nitrous oxide-stimulated promoter family protein [Selenomonas ruminantium]BAL83114.1 hypothetical protein SELR_14060 [Selenomonas ruminantium subsp. lactilytica TAM6421]
MSIDIEKRRQEETQTVLEIIKIYCRGHNHLRANGKDLCPNCRKIADYALDKLNKCPRMDIKTFCSVCPIHCYGKEEAAQIQEMMRYGGPRMLWHHPVMALRHIFIEWRTRHGLRDKEEMVSARAKEKSS